MKPKKATKGAPSPGRNKRGQWLPGVSGCPPDKRQLVPGHKWRFPKGVSGCPGGLSKMRRAFEESFYSALMGNGDPDEAAKLLWECARAKEPWAVQLLLQRIAPQDSKVRLEVSRAEDGIDFSKLSVEDIEVLERILERANAPAIEGGAGGEEPPGVQ